jgi:acetoin utilization deacetylase AcuC-like enzyme
MVTASGFGALTRRLMQLADEVCGGRVVMCHEGGYSPAYVPFCGLAVLEALSGIKTAIDDAFAPIVEGFAGHGLQPHQANVINQAAALAAVLQTDSGSETAR